MLELPWLDGDGASAGDGDGELQLSGGGSSALQYSSTADNSVNNNNALKHKLSQTMYTRLGPCGTKCNVCRKPLVEQWQVLHAHILYCYSDSSSRRLVAALV